MAVAAVAPDPVKAPLPTPPAPKVAATVTAALAPQNSLLGQATNEANTVVQGKVQPLQAEQTQLGTQEKQAVGDIGQEFKTIMPSVADSAARLEQFQKDALAEQQGIYTEAGQNLNAIQQNAAAEAQKLAQQIGGPVSTGQFTAATDPYQGAEAASKAVAGITSANEGLTAARAAETFAGQVFPALQVESEAQARDKYTTEITKLQDEISKAQGTRGALINSNLTKLQNAERTYQLGRARVQLQALNDQQNWRDKQRSLDQRDTALAEAARQHGISNRIAEIKLTDAERKTAATLGIDEQRLKQQAAHYTTTAKLEKQRLDVAQQKNAVSLIDAALAPAGGKPVTLSVKVPISTTAGTIATSGLKLNPNVVRNPDGTYSEWTKRTLTPAQWAAQSGTPNASANRDPQRLYSLLTDQGIPAKMAVALINERLGLNNWKPSKATGKATTFTPQEAAAPTLTPPPGQYTFGQ